MILPAFRLVTGSVDSQSRRRSIDEYAELDGVYTARLCEIGAEGGSWGTEYQAELSKSGIFDLRGLRAALSGFVFRGPCHASGGRPRKSGGKAFADRVDMRAGQRIDHAGSNQ